MLQLCAVKRRGKEPFVPGRLGGPATWPGLHLKKQIYQKFAQIGLEERAWSELSTVNRKFLP